MSASRADDAADRRAGGERMTLRDGWDVLIHRARDGDAVAVHALSLHGERHVGIARYLPDTDRRSAAVTVRVADDWQRRGLGWALLTRLAACAREAGISRFTAAASTADHATLSLLRAMNAEVSVVHRESGTVRYEVSLVRQFCDLCGKETQWAPSSDRPRRVCSACIRTYLPKVQARLAEPWWV